MGFTCMGTKIKTPVAIDDKIVIQDMVTLSSTFDYRLVNPAIIAKFTATMTKYIEDPASMQN